jgi:hypothetical protein
MRNATMMETTKRITKTENAPICVYLSSEAAT